MVIITTFNGKQSKFHRYWLPLMYKHSECEFHVSGEFVYPKDLQNLKVNSTDVGKGPILKCPMDKLPTYRAMIELQKKPVNWIGTDVDLDQKFYEI